MQGVEGVVAEGSAFVDSSFQFALEKLVKSKNGLFQSSLVEG